MAGIEDWQEIVSHAVENGESLTLDPTEVLRLAHDLEAARNTIAKSNMLIMTQEVQVNKLMDLAERFREELEKALAPCRTVTNGRPWAKKIVA
jgi:hypothetical protein